MLLRGSCALRALVCLLLVSWSSAAMADPVTLILLRMLRDHLVTTSLENGVEAMRQPGPAEVPTFGYAPPTFAPALAPEDEARQIKTLVEESFLHLTPAQRAEVHTSLMQALDDPQNHAARPQIIAEFRMQAAAVREAYLQLDRLPMSEKRSLAAQAGQAYRDLPEDERAQLLETVRSGVLPVPRDLNRLMLAQFESASLNSNDVSAAAKP